MEEEALEVLSGVVEGDESSVEGWYLGGWGLWILAEREEEEERHGIESANARAEVETAAEDGGELIVATKDSSNRRLKPSSFIQDRKEKNRITHLRDSRTWLNTCLSLAAQLDYEDERLRDHAQELVQEIERLLLEQGVALEEDEGDEGDEEEGWEGVDSSEEAEEDNERENKTNGDRKSVENATPTIEGGGSGGREVGHIKEPPNSKVDVDVIMSGV